MIVAFESTDQQVSGSSLAMALARLRTAIGRPTAVLVADSVANLSAVSRGEDEVLVDTSASTSGRSASVLAAAEVIVVLVDPHTLDERGPYQLGRLRRAAAANPRARILVTVAPSAAPMSLDEAARVLIFVASIGTAKLADTLVLGEEGACTAHHGPAGGAALGMSELHHLYRQVFQSSDALVG